MSLVTADVRSNGTFTTGATTLSWTHTVSAGLANTVLLVGASTGKAPPHATVSGVNWDDTGTPAALIEKGTGVAESTDSVFADLWFLTSPIPGTSKTIKITASTSCEITGSSSSYYNVRQDSPFNSASPQTAIGTANPQPSLAVTSKPGEMVVDCVGVNESGTDTLVQAAGQTVIGINQVGAGKHTAGSSDAPGSASVTMSWTGVSVSNLWCQIGVSLAAALDAYWPVSTSMNPGLSPGLGGGSSARFQASNWWPYSQPASTSTILSPPEGAIIFSDSAASLTLILAAAAGAVIFAGNVPNISTTLQGVQGSVVISGSAASTTSILAPAAGAVVISGSAPALTQTFVGVTGAVTIGGSAPSTTGILAAAEGAIVIGGNAPSLTVSGGLSPTEGVLTFDGNAPTISLSILGQEGALIVSGNLPGIESLEEGREIGGRWARTTEFITKIKDRFYWFKDESELPKEPAEGKPTPVLKVAQAVPVIAEQVKAELEVQSDADVAKRKRIERNNEAIMKLFI